MKWRNSKERELIAQGGCREQTLPTKHNPNPDLSDPQPLPSPQQHQHRPHHHATPPRTPLEAMAKTRLAFNETLWTLPPPLPQAVLAGNSNEMDDESSDINDETHDDIDEDDIDEDDEEIRVT